MRIGPSLPKFISHRRRQAFYITLLLFVSALITFAQEKGRTPPPEPPVRPMISKKYPEDPSGRRIADELFHQVAQAKSAAQSNALVEIELIFTEPVTQQQIDKFTAMGGEISYMFQTLSYGWIGKIATHRVTGLPNAMGASMILVKGRAKVKAHLYNATQTGRVRTVWTNFAGNSLGFDGNTNITIAIVDSGVDATHTDLSGRQIYWKDWTGGGYTNGTDYYGHGTHVAGIALGTGAAAGSASGAVNFTSFGDLTGVANGNFSPSWLTLPGNLTWRAGAKWTNGASTRLELIKRLYLTSFQNFEMTGTSGTSLLSTSSSITPSSETLYTSGLLSSNSISDYVITNNLANWSASPDSFNRFRGVAPACYWAGVKVLDDSGDSFTSWAESGLDDLVTYRTNYNIKVINMSLGVDGSPGTDTTFRQKVNTAVQNGIVVVVSAGNDGGSSQVDDPGRAAYAITVGSINASNQVTSYTSTGFTSPSSTSGQEEDYKPDIVAPGGSDYTGVILAPDSNNGDSTAFSDQKSNDYAAYKGTSMAAPFVSGAVALLIDAMQQKGLSWDFNSASHPKYVKTILCATASESNANRENNSNNPSLQRATTSGSYPTGKDQYEGYGLLNPDAAIEAVSLSITNNVKETNSLGGTFSSRRAWARKLSLSSYVPLSITLTNPAAGDFDLYIYSTNCGTYGAPVILASSTSSGTGTNETISYTPTTTETALLVVKRVSGSGSFSLMVSNAPNNNFANSYSLSNSSSGSTPGNNSTYTSETGEPSGGGSGKSAWYSWTAPYTGKASFATSLGVVKLYTGSAVNALTVVTSQNATTVASNNFAVVANTTYRIGVDSTGGPYTLAWSYQGIPSLNFTNSTTVTLPTSGTASPYGISNVCSGIPGKIVNVTTTVGGLTTPRFDYVKILMVGPANQKIILKGAIGEGVAVTNATLAFSDSGTTIDNFTSGSGSYRPTDSLSKSISFDSPAPSRPYSTNLSDFISTNASGTWTLYSTLSGTMSSTGSMTNWLLNISLANAPTLTINTTGISYTEGSAATNLTSTATISDSDNWDFSGGTLTVQVTNNAATEDKLFVNHQGTSSGQIGVSGSVVSYGGINFGYYSGGDNGSTPLIVYMTNSSASFAALQALVTRIAYTNTSSSASTNTRTVLFTLNDGLNGTNTASKTISIISGNHAPTVANSIPNQSVNYGASFSYTFATNTFTDSDSGQTLSYSASGSILTNAGISFNSSTRTFSASTIYATNGGTIAGANSIAVIATDNGSPAKSVTNTFTLTINKTNATVTANAASRNYGVTNPTFSGTLSGFLSADAMTATYATTATTNSSPGTYTITPALTDTKSVKGNYNITTNTALLTISKAPVTVIAANQTRAYGSTNSTFTVTYSGLTNGQTLATSDITGSPTLMSSATTNTVPGSYVITNSIGTLTSANYSLTTSNGTLTVTQAVLSVTASNVSRAYGATNPIFAATYSGFVNGQTLASSGVTGSPTLTTSATTNSPAGSYTITNATGTLSAANYSFSLTNGTLTITQAVVTVTAEPASRSYGATNPAFTVTYSGFTNGQSFASAGVLGAPTLTTSAGTNSAVGVYVITNSQGSLYATNYSFVCSNSTLTVTQAVLTVSAYSTSRSYGATNPTFTVTYSGFTNGQSLASSGVTGSPSLVSAAITNSAVGSYVVTNTLGSLAAANYSFNLINGTLTITQASLTVTANNATRTYGATNPIFTGSITGATAGDQLSASFSCAADTNSPAGTYSIIASVVDPGSRLSNYSVTTNNGTLTISKANLLVSADAKTRAYGSPNPTLTASYNGFANNETSSVLSGAPAISTSAQTNSPVGVYTITNLLGTLASANYSFVLSNSSLTITQAPLSVRPDNISRAYGTPNPSLTGSIVGIANNDNISASYFTTASTSSPVGTYPITASLSDPGSKLANYTVTTNQGLLTVTNTSGASNYTATVYLTNSLITLGLNGTQNYTFTDPSSGLGIVVAVTMTPYSASNASPVFNGLDYWPGFPIHMSVFSGINDGNWTDFFEGANFSASLVSASTGIATNTIQFGIAGIGLRVDNGTMSWTSSAATNVLGNFGEILYNTETNAAAISSSTYTAQLRTTSNGGQYQFSDLTTNKQGLVLMASFFNGTVAPKTSLLVAIDDVSRTYGATNPTFTVRYSGFIDGESLATSDVTGSPIVTTSAATNSPVGSYVISNNVGTLSSSKYSFTLTNGTLTVTKAPLVITANNASRAFGSANPTFTASYTGFVNNETLGTSGVIGSPALTCPATIASPAGTYVISNAIGSLSAHNYSFTLVDGLLSVTNNFLVGISLVSPANSESFAAGNTHNLTVNLSGDTNLIGSVRYYQDETLIATVTNAPYSATWTNLYAGTFAIIAVASDSTGASSVWTTNTVTALVNMVSPSRTSNGFSFTFYGEPGESYALYSSTNLSTWSYAGLNYPGSNGPVSVTVTNATATNCFYQLRID